MSQFHKAEINTVCGVATMFRSVQVRCYLLWCRYPRNAGQRAGFRQQGSLGRGDAAPENLWELVHNCAGRKGGRDQTRGVGGGRGGRGGREGGRNPSGDGSSSHFSAVVCCSKLGPQTLQPCLQRRRDVGQVGRPASARIKRPEPRKNPEMNAGLPRRCRLFDSW